MVLVVENPIDLTLYLNVGLLIAKKHPTPNVYHLAWPEWPEIDVEWERAHGKKLYITSHGSGIKVGGKGPNELADILQGLIGLVPFEKVILLSCQTGVKRNFPDVGRSTYCKVFADKYELETGTKIAVTGFDGDHTTRPDGKSRATDDAKESTLNMLIATTLDGEKDAKLASKAKGLSPSNPTELIQTAIKVATKWLTFVKDPADTWPKVYKTHKSKDDSKVYVNRRV